MPPSSIKYRHLGRSSAHRQALLRNLVTSLIDHETITTTWPKAKEAQRVAEKLISLGKRNTPAARSKAQSYLFNPHLYLDKIFGDLRERYATRPGGYTRVLHVEPKEDQAPRAILELVDGPKDIRFAMTARTLMKMREEGSAMNEITSLNVHKVTRFRKDGEESLEKEVKRLENLKIREEKLRDEKKADEGDEADDEEDWVDEEVVERVNVPPSLLKRPKHRPGVVPGKMGQGGAQQPHRHVRRKMAREEAASKANAGPKAAQSPNAPKSSKPAKGPKSVKSTTS